MTTTWVLNAKNEAVPLCKVHGIGKVWEEDAGRWWCRKCNTCDIHGVEKIWRKDGVRNGRQRMRLVCIECRDRHRALTSAEKSRIYRELHPDYSERRNKQLLERDPDLWKHNYEKYSESMKQSARKYYQEHKEEISLRDAQKKCSNSLAAQEVLGGSCIVCGNSDPDVLQFDHINNDGAQDRAKNPSMNSGINRWIIKHPEEAKQKLQLLCANCHMKKHSKFRRCA